MIKSKKQRRADFGRRARAYKHRSTLPPAIILPDLDRIADLRPGGIIRVRSIPR